MSEAAAPGLHGGEVSQLGGSDRPRVPHRRLGSSEAASAATGATGAAAVATAALGASSTVAKKRSEQSTPPAEAVSFGRRAGTEDDTATAMVPGPRPRAAGLRGAAGKCGRQAADRKQGRQHGSTSAKPSQLLLT